MPTEKNLRHTARNLATRKEPKNGFNTWGTFKDDIDEYKDELQEKGHNINIDV